MFDAQLSILGQPILVVQRRDVGDFQLGGAAVRVHPNRRDTVQPQEDKIHEVILRKGFFLQMSVDQTQAPQAPTATAAFGEVRNQERAGTADQDGLDRSISG